MMTEEEETKDEGTEEEADQDQIAETASARKDQQGTMQMTHASTNQARTRASSPRNLKPTRPQNNSKDGRSNSTPTG